MPWYLPEYSPLRKLTSVGFEFPRSPLTPATCDSFYSGIDTALQTLTHDAGISPQMLELANQLRGELTQCKLRIARVTSQLRGIAEQSERLVRDMNFEILVNKRRKLLSVGYDVNSQKLAKSCYDLLASESRTAAFISIAKGDAPQESWFRLGRQHTLCEGETVLTSWTGTMFEYLMPVIWMKSHPNTLLDRSAHAAVRVQRAYVTRAGVPWGISEAAFSKRDEAGNYQYAAFGVPGVALHVTRPDCLVVSPYSSCLALQVDPVNATLNLRNMTAKKKWMGTYGLYESADYTGTPHRALSQRKYHLVRCWMAHHQGMSLAAICNLLQDSAFQRWFHAEPLVQASELILQERPLRVKAISATA